MTNEIRINPKADKEGPCHECITKVPCQNRDILEKAELCDRFYKYFEEVIERKILAEQKCPKCKSNIRIINDDGDWICDNWEEKGDPLY